MMKRENKRRVIFFLLLACVTSLFGIDQVYTPPFEFVNPQISGQGGGLAAGASGFSALMGNPAAFGLPTPNIRRKKDPSKGELTILSLGLDVAPDSFNFFKPSDGFPVNPTPITNSLERYGVWSFSSSVASGYVGNGWGGGLFINPSLLSIENPTTGVVRTSALLDVELPFGYSVHVIQSSTKPPPKENTPQGADSQGDGFDAWGSASASGKSTGGKRSKKFDLWVGGDIRPIYRVLLNDSTLLGALGGSFGGSSGSSSFQDSFKLSKQSGWGIGFDLGVIAKYDYWQFGLALRDVGGTYVKFDDVTLTTPMTVMVGVEARIPTGKLEKYFSPSFYAEYVQPIVWQDLTGYEPFAPANSFNFGVSVDLLDHWLVVRAGLKQGKAFSTGISFNLVAVVINASYYTDIFPGLDSRTTKLATEVAFRY